MPSSVADEALKLYISRHLDAYLSAFNRKDLTTTASYYHEPSTIVTSDGISVFQTQGDVVRLLNITLARLQQQGFQHSKWEGEKNINILELVVKDDGEVVKGLVIASCPFRRLRTDGTVVEQFTGTYTLRMVGAGEWMIVGAVQHDFERQLE